MKKRIGKDFDAVITVKRNYIAINLSDYEVLSVMLESRTSKSIIPETEWQIREGKILVHVPRELVKRDGEHWFTIEYRKADSSITDGYRNYEDNTRSFTIVKRTEDEDDGDLTTSVDLVDVIRGKPGKPVVMHFEVDENMHLWMNSTEDNPIDFEIVNGHLKLVI